MNVKRVGVGRVGVCMLCTCVRKEGGGEKSVESESLSEKELEDKDLLTITFTQADHERGCSGVGIYIHNKHLSEDPCTPILFQPYPHYNIYIYIYIYS